MDLHDAAYSGQTAVVKLLIGQGVDRIIQLLLNKGADVNAQGGQFGTALQAAVYTGATEIIQLLLNKGADVNAQGGQFGTALQAAVYEGKIEIVQLLLDVGADVNAQGGQYGTSLQAAAYQGVTEIVRLLINHGADVNNQGGEFGTALQAAVHEGKTEIVDLLLGYGADVNVQGGIYGTALQAAASRGMLEIVRLLLDVGTDVNIQGGIYGTALHAAAWTGMTNTVRLLLDNGADVNIQGGEYRTALHAATVNRNTDVVRVLLDRGAWTNIPNFSGTRPLQVSVQNRNLRTARLLLPRSIDSMQYVAASAWRSLLPGRERHLEIVNGQSMTITKRLEDDIRGRGYPLLQDITELPVRTNDFMGVDIRYKCLFALDDGVLLSSSSTGVRRRWWRKVRLEAAIQETFGPTMQNTVWKLQSNTVPSSTVLAQIPAENCFVECGFSTRAVILSKLEDFVWPHMSNTEDFVSRKLQKTYGIAWIMTKCQDERAIEGSLESRIFFSTSEHAEVPVRAAELLTPLVQQLRQDWAGTFQVAESRLAMMRMELLKSNGSNPRLVQDFPGDAQIWDLLERSCSRQIAELKAFKNAFISWVERREDESEYSDLNIFDRSIEDLEQEYRNGLKSLANTSRELMDLIQLVLDKYFLYMRLLVNL
ncbi:DNA methylase, N-6 adenine-specific, conserved site [Corynascus novoguineensis]|uniref:DNA methylase, N-6 adenine-specific, conserved site n=1 Tax=Corynascus novoguineensis TaxID=1126955 RepID=A0AAN7CMW6_9PEZI|nr:DNA methylase, N-6 adenine-specific, conserved site [Corynascus novoguineensis]